MSVRTAYDRIYLSNLLIIKWNVSFVFTAFSLWWAFSFLGASSGLRILTLTRHWRFSLCIIHQIITNSTSKVCTEIHNIILAFNVLSHYILLVINFNEHSSSCHYLTHVMYQQQWVYGTLLYVNLWAEPDKVGGLRVTSTNNEHNVNYR